MSLFYMYLVLSVIVTVSCSQLCEPGSDWVHHKGRCYWASNDGPGDLVNYTTAVTRCENMGAALVSITDQPELDFVKNITGCDEGGYHECADIHHGIRQYWINLEQNPPVSIDETIEARRARWTWMDGSLYLWSNWYDGPTAQEHEPTGGYGRVRLLHSGKWADCAENERLRYICKLQSGIMPLSTSPSPSSISAVNTGPTPASEQGNHLFPGIGIAIGILVLIVIGIIVLVAVVSYKGKKRESSGKAVPLSGKLPHIHQTAGVALADLQTSGDDVHPSINTNGNDQQQIPGIGEYSEVHIDNLKHEGPSLL